MNTGDDIWYPATTQRLNCSFQWSPQGYTPEAQQKFNFNLPTKSSGEQFCPLRQSLQTGTGVETFEKESMESYLKVFLLIHDCWHFIVFFYPVILLHSESKCDGTLMHS